MSYVPTQPRIRAPRGPRMVWRSYWRRTRRGFRIADGRPLIIPREAAVALAASATLAALRGAR